MKEGESQHRSRRLFQACTKLIGLRRLVGDHIGFEICADPAWDMLLDLYVSEYRGRNIAISSLASAANVPPTTARRCIRALRKLGWVSRQPDPGDGRRIYIKLTSKARFALEAVLERA